MIALLEINAVLEDTNCFCFRSFRTEPADTLTFATEPPIPRGARIALKARDAGASGMQTLFQGTLQASGYAVNAPELFTALPPRNWRNVTAHALIRDLCSLAHLGAPTLACQDRLLAFFQGRKNAALSLQSLLGQLKCQGEREDLSFYVDPAGGFYFGRFQNWKQPVEVLQESDNLLNWQQAGKTIRASVIPDANLFHSQALQLYTTQHDGVFVRCEGVKLEFKNGEIRQEVVMRAS